MDQDPTPPDRSPRKYKFPPKLPQSSRRRTQPVPRENDVQERATQTRNLQNFTATVGRRKSGAGNKPPNQVAFQPSSSSTSIRSFGTRSEDNGDNSKTTNPELPPSDTLPTAPSPIATDIDKEDVHLLDDGDALAPNPASGYKEPWDYSSYYPTVLPLRRPFSGDPDLLNEKEFGEGASKHDESTINAAKELDLTLEEQGREKMFLFQLPTLPRVKQSTNTKGKEKIGSPTSMSGPKKDSNLEDFPEGYMGKMLVYKSGKIKMKLGDIPFDVNPGGNSDVAEDAMVINTKDRQCCVVGSIVKHVVVTPDVDHLLDSTEDMGHGK